MVRRPLLDGIGQAQNGLFIEWLADQLQADGQASGGEPTRPGGRREAGQGEGNSENIGKEPREGGGGLFPDLEGRRRRRRGNEDVDATESLLEIPPDQCPYLLCLAIVCVVVPGAERI